MTGGSNCKSGGSDGPGGDNGQALVAGTIYSEGGYNDSSNQWSSTAMEWTADKAYDSVMITGTPFCVYWNMRMGENLSPNQWVIQEDWLPNIANTGTATVKINGDANSPKLIKKASYWLGENIAQGDVVRVEMTGQVGGFYHRGCLAASVFPLE